MGPAKERSGRQAPNKREDDANAGAGSGAPGGRDFANGARLFNEGAFYEAHEVWEEQWRKEADESRRRLLQGLIQVAAGFHKLTVARSGDSALRLLTKGLAKLDACSNHLIEPEIAAFRDQARACAISLAAHSRTK